jgi:TetR/AcrR family transcriptional regulator
MSRPDARSIILRAAQAEFAEHGFAGARVDRIAQRAGLNKQLIYYYFGSKAGLHSASVSAGTAGGARPVASPDGGPPGTLRSAVATIVQVLEERPELVSLLVDPGATAEARCVGAAWVEKAVKEVEAAVSRGQAEGRFRDDVDPHAVARHALVLCIGYIALAPILDLRAAEWSREVEDTLVRSAAW